MVAVGSTQAWAQVVAVGMAQAVVQGAQVCVEYWVAQGEASMVAEAEARLSRVLSGTANEVDIEGALDWLDA